MPPKNIITNQKISPTKLQRAKELRCEGTPAEKILWQALRRNQLGGFHFRRQQIIGGFIADFTAMLPGWSSKWMAESIAGKWNTTRNPIISFRHLAYGFCESRTRMY